MKCCARSTRLSLAMPVSSSGKATLSTTLRQGKVDSSWNTMPIDLCGPSISSPPTRTVPSCCASRPPMTLNTVDLPQPDGPMIDRNSPGRTENDTPSTATTGPSAVSKRTASWSATRMGASIAGLLALVAFGAGHGRHRGGGIAGRDADVDDGNMAVVDRGDRLFQHRGQVGDGLDRAEALRALRPRHRREVDVGFGNALADPAVLDRTVAHARDSLLMQFVVEEGAIVGDHDEQRDAVMRRGPDRGDAHEEVAVAADADGHAARAFQRQRRADADAGAAADAAAAVGAEKVERVAQRDAGAVPRQRQMRKRDVAAPDRFAQRGRHVIDGERVALRHGQGMRIGRSGTPVITE